MGPNFPEGSVWYGLLWDPDSQTPGSVRSLPLKERKRGGEKEWGEIEGEESEG